eukprot:Polyplicarium_translucidae@DN4417_c0_g1_i1.p1
MRHASSHQSSAPVVREATVPFDVAAVETAPPSLAHLILQISAFDVDAEPRETMQYTGSQDCHPERQRRLAELSLGMTRVRQDTLFADPVPSSVGDVQNLLCDLLQGYEDRWLHRKRLQVAQRRKLSAAGIVHR